MRLLLFLLLGLITGCATLRTPSTVGTADDYNKIPLRDLFNEIINEPYKIHIYDCSNKCAKYVRALKKAGHDADIIIVKPYDSPIGLLHAIVRIKLNDGYLYVDPTNDGWSRSIRSFGTFLSIMEWKGVEANYEAFGDRLHEIDVIEEYTPQ